MIRLAEKPHDISFSKNPIVFKVNNENNGNLIVTNNAQSIFTINIPGVNGNTTDIFNDGQILTLSFTVAFGLVSTDFSQSFVFKDNPIAEEIGTFETLNSIFEKIRTNHIVAPYLLFILKTEIDSVSFITECISSNIAYSVEWSVTLNTQDFVITAVPAAVTTDTEGTYKLYFEKRYKGGEWKEVFTGSFIILNYLGFAYLNVDDIIDSECMLSIPENPFSHYSRSEPTICDNVRRYYARFIHGAQILTDNVRFAMIAGTPNRIWLSYQLLQSITKDNSFLSYQPDAKRIPRNAIEYITWFNYTGDTQNINVYVTPYNGNTRGNRYIPNGYEATVPAGLSITLPIHPNALQISNDVTHYEYVVRSESNANISPIRTVIISESSRLRSLAYLNDFNAPEVATCKGDTLTKIIITAESWNSIRNIQSGASILKNERIVAKVERKYTYRTGYITAKQKEAYTELSVSSRVFDITTPQYFGLVVIDAKTEETTNDDGQKNYSLEWQLQPILSEYNFAPDDYTRSITANAEPPQFPQGVGGATGISTGLKAFELTQAEFDALKLAELLQEGIYFITDTNPQEVWFSGGGSIAVDITYGPLRYVKLELTGLSTTLEGISITTAEQRKRMRFYRGQGQIFIDEDFTILPNDVVQFNLPFENETFRAFY